MSGQVPTEWGWMDTQTDEIQPWTEHDECEARHGMLKGAVVVLGLYVVASGLFYAVWAVIKIAHVF